MPGNNAVFMSDVSLTNHLGSRYVPPHLRNRPDADEKDLELVGKLARQLKGLLNRLVHIQITPDHVMLTAFYRMSEQNMAVILDSIEEVYRKHRRHGKLL